jgi:hypothetical protein
MTDVTIRRRPKMGIETIVSIVIGTVVLAGVGLAISSGILPPP